MEEGLKNDVVGRWDGDDGVAVGDVEVVGDEESDDDLAVHGGVDE